jgi:hypothetical protein
MFRMILTINCDYYFKRHYGDGLYIGEAVCFLCGRNGTLKCYLQKCTFQSGGVLTITQSMHAAFNEDNKKILNIELELQWTVAFVTYFKALPRSMLRGIH